MADTPFGKGADKSPRPFPRPAPRGWTARGAGAPPLPQPPAELLAGMDSAEALVPAAFDDVWRAANERPGVPAFGALSDGWAGAVRCGVLLFEDDGAVVLDFPADHLEDGFKGTIMESGWRVARKRAVRAPDDHRALRYIIELERRIPLSP